MKNKNSISVKSILMHIEKINENLKDSGLKPEAIRKSKVHIDALSKFINCNENQTILFALIFGLNLECYEVSLEQISRFVDCNNFKIAALYKDFEVLIQKKLIIKGEAKRNRLRRLNEYEFYIPFNMLEKISSGAFLENNKKKYENFIDILGNVKNIFEEYEEMNKDLIESYSEIIELFEENKKNNECKQVLNMKLSKEEMCLYLMLLVEAIDGNEDILLNDSLNKIYQYESPKKFKFKKEIVNGSNRLVKEDFIKLEDSAFWSDRSVSLTEKSLEMFFSEETEIFTKNDNKQLKQIIKCEDLVYKELFFNERELQQLRILEETLLESNLSKIRERLKQEKLSEGITVLFHGAPGTGKTESVYQLAKKSGRDILFVDISSLKSCWFGESEKLVKKQFETYRKLVGSKKITPILLFNEADAVFGKRKDTAIGAVAQTENAIQNIILQELENLKGILIATTNMTDNFDPAFERRFLFKIRFDKPTSEVQAKIWKSKIKNLDDDSALLLGTKFNFSGGQIDNVCRKIHTHYIIEGEEPSIDTIIQFCEEETLSKKYSKIGFTNN